MLPFPVFCGQLKSGRTAACGSVYVLCIFLRLHGIAAQDLYFCTTSSVMSKFTRFTGLAMTFDCFCMIQAAYCCISRRIVLLRNTERGAMRVFQIHFRRRGVYLFPI